MLLPFSVYDMCVLFVCLFMIVFPLVCFCLCDVCSFVLFVCIAAKLCLFYVVIFFLKKKYWGSLFVFDDCPLFVCLFVVVFACFVCVWCGLLICIVCVLCVRCVSAFAYFACACCLFVCICCLLVVVSCCGFVRLCLLCFLLDRYLCFCYWL